jgi:hypothetical protein
MKHVWLVLTLTLALASGARALAQSCGFQPLKPLVPLGCKDLVASCVCDAEGRNCKWQWTCVPNKR